MKIIPFDYQGVEIGFSNDGWINATQAAAKFGKRPIDWLRLPDTQEYIEALAEVQEKSEVGKSHFGLARTKRGGKSQGTWLHPDLVVPFARWLEVRFAVACDQFIKRQLQGGIEWQELRDAASINYQGMSDAVAMARSALGKHAQPHHFMNEAKLVNGVLYGEYKGRDRQAMTPGELRIVAMVEQRNGQLIAQGKTYQQRKAELTDYARSITTGKIGRAS